MTPYLFGKYCLLERISVGGMAEVFRAKPLNAPDFTGYLALKRILPHLAEDDEFIMMFVDEAKLTVQLNHPNIVRIYELGQFQSAYYILMEYIAGKDLLTLQKRVRRLREVIGVSRSAYIAREIARGLHYAHNIKDANGVPLNIIHRDVSPQNVLVDYLGNIKVIDFGIAKAAVQSTRTQVGVLKGKMGYMSPEQVMGSSLDCRSDIFAIGTVLWEMLTNKRLFNGENEFETMQLVRSAQVERPSIINSEVPPDLERIVMRALTADRDLRYASAGDLADELDDWLATNPCDAEDLSIWMRQVFAEDLDEELQKREQFAEIQTPDDIRRIAEASADEPPTVEENYEKTEVWDGELLVDDVDPLEFAAQHTIVQAGGFDIDEYLAAQRGTPSAYGEAWEGTPMAYGQVAATPIAVDNEFQSQGTQPGLRPLPPPVDNTRKIIAIVLVVLVFILLLGVVGLLVQRLSKPDAPHSGAVLITAQPATARILLNGAPFACAVPCRIENLGVGTHLIEVVDANYKPFSQPIEVVAGKVLPLDVILEPAGPKLGVVRVNFPDDIASMSVFVDGELRRREDLEPAIELPLGEHLIEVIAPGFRPFKKFAMVDGTELSVDVTMTESRFPLRVTAPSNSVVRLNGERIGTVPVDLKLDPFTLNDLEVSLRDDGVSKWRSKLALPTIASPQIDVDFDNPPRLLKEKNFGWLTASTGDDWWAVWIDDLDTGVTTPIDAMKRLPVEAGKHVISFRRGYDQHDLEVEVRGGETVVIREDFKFAWKP